MGLLDVLQGASNAAASNVSGPVDMLAWALRKAGVPVPQNPVMGEAWMREKGLLATPQNKYAGAAGETLGLLAPFGAAAKAPQIAKGLLAAEDAGKRGAYAVGEKGNDMAQGYMARQGLMKPATVWHGSPHKFDKFDSSKIGTGEGAQAYGHGLYLAEAPETAAFYQQKLTSDGTLGGYKSANEARQRILLKTADRVEATDPTRAAKLRADADAITPGGALYKVDLPDEKIARMLDWDAPLSRQAPEVRQALPEFANRGVTSPQGARTMTGEEIIGELGRAHAERLRRAGIPGVRYLDGGSRGAGGGTSNYVVFPGEENALTILERNGQRLR